MRVHTLLTLTLLAFSVVARERVVASPSPRTPLDPQTLKAVSLEFGSVDLEPGATHTLRLTQIVCCAFPTDVPAEVRFSMDPSDFATVDPDTGFLKIAPNAWPGLSFRIYADIEHGRRIVSADVNVYTRNSNPLRGYWTQLYEVLCNGGGLYAPTLPIQSLQFRGDGRFSVTWILLELYTDYWGFYTFDKPAGHLTMGIRDGNYIPPVFAGDGTYTITEQNGVRTLTLHGHNLGLRSSDAGHPPVCGAIFTSTP